MLRCAILLCFGLLLLNPTSGQETGESTEPDLTGIWHSRTDDLIVRRTGAASFMGHATEGKGAEAGRTWHFQSLGGEDFQFWITLEGGATIEKQDDQRIKITGGADRITLNLGGASVEFRRLLGSIPEKVSEISVSFLPPVRDRVKPGQNVDIRLARALASAAAAARQADPELKRLNVSKTINRGPCPSGRHSRLKRRAFDIDRVNGAGAEHWRTDVQAKLKALKAGDAPDVDLRRDYARHVTALVLALLVEADIEEVICPAVLDEDTIPYLMWWLARYSKGFPDRYPSSVTFKKKIEEMLVATRANRRKMKSWLHVSVGPREKEPCSHKRSKEKKHDQD